MNLPLFRLPCFACCLALALSAVSLGAFTVAKDVNRPPVEAVVLFAKGAPSDRLVFPGSPETPFSIAKDGSLQLPLKGPVALDARLSWTPGKDLPATFPVTAHAYLMLTCRVEGCDRQPLANGKSIERRPGDLWLPVALFDAEGDVIGEVDLASVAPGGVTPAKTVVLRIPTFLFTFWADASKPIPPFRAIGFVWARPRPPSLRDYRIVIDRIALAD